MPKPASRFEHLFGPQRPACDAADESNGRRPERDSRERRIETVSRGGGFRRFPRHGKANPLFEIQHPGRMGRGQFPGAEPDSRARPDPDARPQRGERTLERIERRAVERLLRAGFAGHPVEQRRAPFRAKDRVAAVEERPRHRLASDRAPLPRTAAPSPSPGYTNAVFGGSQPPGPFDLSARALKPARSDAASSKDDAGAVSEVAAA